MKALPSANSAARSTTDASAVVQALDTPGLSTPSRAQAAKSSNAFALALWAEARRSVTGNATLSPLSLFAGLSLARLGAGGTTASELERTLRFEGPAATAYLATLRAIRPDPPSLESSVQLAARLFVDRNRPLDPAYVARSRSLGEAVEALDFQHFPEPARVHVNTWVSEQTHAKISELVPQGAVAADTKVVLANALSFSARWAKPFQIAETRPEPFHVSAKGAPNVPTLHMNESLGVGSAQGVKWLRLPYSGGTFAMTVVLPRQGQSLDDLERALDAPTLTRWLADPPLIPASVLVPKFRVHTPEALSLSQVLRAMGITAAFAASSADFSPMTGATAPQDRFFIRDVFEQAVVEIDENGTEAAAASALSQSAGAQLATQKPAEFRADRPFLFLISEVEHDTLLFIGRVSDPTAG